jgi:hypothetical protein
VTHTIVGLLSVVVAVLLIWLMVRIVNTGTADLGMAGPVMRKDEPTTFWVLTVGLAVMAVLLLMLAAVLFVEGPITTLEL